MRILALLGLSVAFMIACEDNTVCDTGTLLCTNADGEVTEDGDQQLRECTTDEARGGDEDGEFVVVEDCAASGNACATELFPASGDELGACITRACKDDGIVDCLQVGRTTCGFDARLLVCGLDEESGCQRYSVDEACQNVNGSCVEEGSAATCVSPEQ